MITLDLLGIDRDAVLGALRELDREAGARLKAYPKMVVDGKLTLEAAARRQAALATAREVCACVARGMIAEDGVGRGVRVLPAGAVVAVDQDDPVDQADSKKE